MTQPQKLVAHCNMCGQDFMEGEIVPRTRKGKCYLFKDPDNRAVPPEGVMLHNQYAIVIIGNASMGMLNVTGDSSGWVTPPRKAN